MLNTKIKMSRLIVAALVAAMGLIGFATPVGAQSAAIEDGGLLRQLSLEGRTLASYQADYSQSLSADAVVERAKPIVSKAGWRLDPKALERRDDYHLVIRRSEDPSAVFEIDTRSGSFVFNGGLADYRKDDTTPGLPDEGEAESVAKRFLESLALSPDAEQVGNVHVGGLSMGALQRDGSTTIYRKLVTVRMDRQIGGLPVVGDSRIVVHIGREGQLAGLIYQWPQVRQTGEASPRSLRDEQELRGAIEARLERGGYDAERIVLTKADLVLYEDDRGVFEPAFHVEAQLYYEVSVDGEKDRKAFRYDVPFDFFVPVLKEPKALYPFMEEPEEAPTDARNLKTEGKDDE